MAEVRPLYFVGKPTEPQRLALRQGKDSLGVPWYIKPVEVTEDPGETVLAFVNPPFFIWSYALLTPPYTPARMAAALKEIYGLLPPDHLRSGEDWLSAILPGTTYIGTIDIE